MMVDYLGADPEEANEDLDRTRRAHARFEYLKKVYTHDLQRAHQATDNDKQVGLHGAYSMRAYLLYLVGTVIFVDKNVTYTDAFYLWYFQDFEQIHEYN